MVLTGTEREVINCVARLREATKDQIRSEIGFSLDYIDFLCRYLVRKGYLAFYNGRYSLREEIKIPVTEVKYKTEEKEDKIKIKTDFEFPVDDESLALESNINKIGPSLEREKSDIAESIKLLRNLQKRRKI